MTTGATIRWSAAAEALFRLDRPTAVSAGAGSGKTTALVELCLKLLSGEATGTPHDPSEIVAITFTEKASEELTERLREALATRARPSGAAEGTIEARAWLERFHGLDRMAVGTIHGFAGRLLREHALEAGVDPEFTVLEEEAAVVLREEAARAAVVAAADAGRPAALELCAGHGAGGRRRGLAAVVAEVVRERATLGLSTPPMPAPGDVQAAVRARRRLLDAVSALLAANPERTTASGRTALAALAGAFESLTPGDMHGALGPGAAARLEALAGAVRRWRPGKADGEALSRARDELLDGAEALMPLAAEVLGEPQRRELCGLIADAEVRYAAAKAAARALDFDDLLVRARDLLVRDGPLRLDLRRRTRALLVDEYQDVNRLQQEIFDLLVGPDPEGNGSPAPTLVAVGDLKQSIYRFRGADVAVFADLLERLGTGRGGRVLHLVDNHRSTPAAIELVNAVSERCMQPAGAPRPYEIRFGEADRLVPMRRGGMAPACEMLEDGDDGTAAQRRAREARAIAERIRVLVSGAAGVTVVDRGPDGVERSRPPRFADLALLFRRLTQIGEYERALREAGIPYRLARGGGFYQAPEVRDLGELLASLFEPGDAAAWAALLRSPLCGVSEGTLLLLSRLGLGGLWRREPGEVVEAVREMWVEALSISVDLDAELDRLGRFLREWRALRALRDRMAVHEVLERAAERLDLEAALLAGPEGERRAMNVRKALGLARRFSEAGGGATAFGERLRRLAAEPPREPEAELEEEDAVAILSVHQAKGLEWPVVFIPDLGARPRSDSRRALIDGEGRLCAAWFDLAGEEFHATTSLLAAREEGRRSAAAESRRLLYVALTRARDYLVLSGEARRSGEDSWAALVARAAEACPRLVHRLPAAEAGRFAVAPAVAAAPAAPPPESPAPTPPRIAPAPPLAAVRLAVTDLVEYARCPRRHWLARTLGLPERAAAPGAESNHDDPARATARGTLAHAMLSEADLDAPPLERRAQLAASAARRGHDPSSRGVRRILADVFRFLDSPAGRRLAALSHAGALSREVPFLLRVDGSDGVPACYLTGAIDALAMEPAGIAVVDFKYALPRPQAVARYRLQLVAYALAASRAMPGRRVRASLQFLRGSFSTLDLTPQPEELARFEAAAPQLALGAFRGDGEWRTPAELGRDEARCRAEGCGYVYRCYPPLTSTRSPLPSPPFRCRPDGGRRG